MKTEYIGCYQVPDGYFGEKAIVHLLYDNQTNYSLEVHETGYFKSVIPCALNVDEVKWLMNNHPVCKGRYLTIH